MQQYDYTLYETKYWKVILNEEQSYLGRCVIVLKRKRATLSDVSSEEWLDFHKSVVIKLESTLKNTFGATMFNWSCLMNNAYQETNPDPFVHFHLRPRYKHSVIFAKHKFHDPDFGHHYNRDRKFFATQELLEKIYTAIKKNV